jgi:hypothetical protein
MTTQQTELRRALLDAVAIEVRKVVDKVNEAELDSGLVTQVIDSVDAEWHVTITYNRQQAFVRVTGHTRRDQDLPEGLPEMLRQVFGSNAEFDFNAPVDWVPRSLLS